jgi:hypothetical protein
MNLIRTSSVILLLGAVVQVAAAQPASNDKQVYRCPGNPVLYTDTISAKEAKDKGCKSIEGTPITIVPAVKARPSTGSGTSTASPGNSQRTSEGRVDESDQRARDNDARRILEDELRKEEIALAALKAEYNNGEPDRRGDEKNYQKYLDRTAELKAGIARKESDVAALKRELGKL